MENDFDQFIQDLHKVKQQLPVPLNEPAILYKWINDQQLLSGMLDREGQARHLVILHHFIYTGSFFVPDLPRTTIPLEQLLTRKTENKSIESQYVHLEKTKYIEFGNLLIEAGLIRDFKHGLTTIVKTGGETKRLVADGIATLVHGGRNSSFITTLLKQGDDRFSQYISHIVAGGHARQQLEWNPNVMTIDHGNPQARSSASSILFAHEIWHAVLGVYAPIEQEAMLRTPHAQFKNHAEAHVIINFENPILKSMNNEQRLSYFSWVFSAKGVNSRDVALLFAVNNGSLKPVLEINPLDVTGTIIGIGIKKTWRQKERREVAVMTNQRDIVKFDFEQMCDVVSLSLGRNLPSIVFDKSASDLLEDAYINKDNISIELKAGQLPIYLNPSQRKRLESYSGIVQLSEQTNAADAVTLQNAVVQLINIVSQWIVEPARGMFRMKSGASEIVSGGHPGEIIEDTVMSQTRVEHGEPECIYVVQEQAPINELRFHKGDSVVLPNDVITYPQMTHRDDKTLSIGDIGINDKDNSLQRLGEVIHARSGRQLTISTVEEQAISAELGTKQYKVFEAISNVTIIRGIPFKPLGLAFVYYHQIKMPLTEETEVVRLSFDQVKARGIDPDKIKPNRKDNDLDSFTVPDGRVKKALRELEQSCQGENNSVPPARNKRERKYSGP